MTEKQDNGGPAFPFDAKAPDGVGGYSRWPRCGMSLRDYFAAKAMVAIVSTPNPIKIGDKYTSTVDLVAECAYQYADAMLAEREKRR